MAEAVGRINDCTAMYVKVVQKQFGKIDSPEASQDSP
jgi:hypothetical protein